MSLFRRIFPNYRSLGDLSRSKKHWTEAETCYRRHLKRHPEDTAIWVQLGHALKEQEYFSFATEAYGRAYALTLDNDIDLAMHYAFALSKCKRRVEAREILIDAYMRQPDETVRGQIIYLDDRDGVDWEVKSDGAVFFSVHDLLKYLMEFPTMSGIQRVQAGVALHAVLDETLDSHFIVNSLTGSRDTLRAGEFWLIDGDDLRGIIEYASGSDVDHPWLRRLIFAAEERARRARPGEGNTVILLGAFWGLGNSVQAFVPCWRAGAVIGAYIYDIIPISHPQYCDPGLVRDFTMCFSEICAIADFFLTISEFTRNIVHDYLAAKGLPDIPSATVPLAHSLTGVSSATPALPKKLARHLGGRDFVAYVSTVEGRKNHQYVVEAWIEMKAAGIMVPDLVFVGRKGWRVDDLFDLLVDTDFLGSRVHIIHNLSDGELKAVYTKSLFTVFTSHVEGWGLPVGESLVHGTPCIASNTSSIPEVGGDFVDYVDPNDLPGGVALFADAITNPAFLAKRREQIAAEFRPRDWDVVGADFIAKVANFAQRIGIERRALRAHIPYGTLMRLNELAQPTEDLAAYIHNPWRLLLSSFYQPEAMGAWMRGASGEIRFGTGLPEGTEIELHLRIVVAPWAESVELEIVADARPFYLDERLEPGSAKLPDIGTRRFRRFDLSELRFSGGRRLAMRIGPSGICALHFLAGGRYRMASHDPRQFVLGIAEIGFARSDDVLGRMNLIESYQVRPLSEAPTRSAIEPRD